MTHEQIHDELLILADKTEADYPLVSAVLHSLMGSILMADVGSLERLASLTANHSTIELAMLTDIRDFKGVG